MLSSGCAGVDVGDATGSNGSTSTTGDVDCSMDSHAACDALWNSTFADVAEVANQHTVVPDFDDDRLDEMCR